MVKKPVMLIVALAAAASVAHALDLPYDAFRLLAATTAEPCTICVKQDLEKAFAIMNASLAPGIEMRSDSACSFVKTAEGDENALTLSCYPPETFVKSLKADEKAPQVVLVFYTPDRRLVGISETDFTGRETAETYRAAPAGTVFEGRIRLIPYKYGDGPAYNYFRSTNKLRIHCVLVEIRASPVR